MDKKPRAKAGFNPVRHADQVHHFLDVQGRAIGTSPSNSTRDEFLRNQAVPLTVEAGPCLPIQYELTRERTPNVAERKFPIGMLQHLVQGDYHVVLSERQIGTSRIQYMRLGAKPFPPFMELPANPRIAYSEPQPGELKIAHPDHAHAATAWLLQGKSINDLNPDGSLKEAVAAKMFDNKPFA